MWQQHRGFGRFGMMAGGIGPVTRRLLFITVGIFIIHFLIWPRPGMQHTPFERVFGLSRQGMATGMLWQVVTYSFLHGGFWHLLGNMLGLYFFGTELEQRLGSRRFLLLYLGCGVLGGLGWMLLSAGTHTICIGASASVFGVLGTFAALYPRRQITLLVFFVLPVTLTARTLILVAGGVSLLLLRTDAGGIAHAAHLAGGAAGYIYGLRLAGGAYRGGGMSGLSWNLQRLFADWRARLRRGQFRVMRDQPDDAPVDWQEVDRILLKVRALGMGALTKRERDALDRASRQVR